MAQLEVMNPVAQPVRYSVAPAARRPDLSGATIGLYWLLICPEHAQIFAREGWGRERIQEAMYGAARLPFRTLMLNKERPAMAASHPELGFLWDHPELPVPIVEDPSCFEIVVVGGAAGRGAYFYGAGEPVTMPVEDVAVQ